MAGLTYAERLKRLRIRNAMSQKELADKIEVTQATISNWERGNGGPSAEQKKQLKKILGAGAAGKEKEAANDHPDVGATSTGAWLNKARVGSGMSVSELAAAAKLSPQAIYNIESGRIANPRENTVRKLERALRSELPEETKAEIKEEATIDGFGQLEDFDPHNKSERTSFRGSTSSTTSASDPFTLASRVTSRSESPLTTTGSGSSPPSCIPPPTSRWQTSRSANKLRNC